jgi:hypothetical protein
VVLLVLGREAGDQVRADGDIGPRAAGARPVPPHRAQWRRFIRLRIRSCPCCSERWRCGITRGSPASSSNSSGSISTPSSEDRRRRGRAGKGIEDRRAPARRGGAARQVMRPSWSRRPRSARLRRALRQRCFDLAQHLRNGQRAARPAALRDDAEGAGMVAAVLHRDEGAVCAPGRGAGSPGTFQARGSSLAALATSPSTSGIAPSAVALDLGGAAGHQQPRIRPVAARAADRLAGLAHGFGGDRAGIDHDQDPRPPAARASARFRRC